MKFGAMACIAAITLKASTILLLHMRERLAVKSVKASALRQCEVRDDERK